ncbi:MAG: VWA domain-containing protein [Myxococcota bacterium]
MSREDTLRQAVLWRTLASTLGMEESAGGLPQLSREAGKQADLPDVVLDGHTAISSVLQRYPELQSELGPGSFAVDPAAVAAGDDDEADDAPPATGDDAPISLRRSLLFSKLLLGAFGPNTQGASISAGQYQSWLADVAAFETAMGGAPGSLRSGRGGIDIGDADLQRALQTLEKDLIHRMALREVLADRKLAAQITPSMAVVEQLLRDKANLSGEALRNARSLIRRYVDELADVLKVQVKQAPAAKLDSRVPPKRVFRNLDLKKTIWKNLSNWNVAERRLYVDRLFYRRTAKRIEPKRLIVVVDQSGSMVDAMVQCTILASIFAQLPHVDAHLVAFDTRVLDLTPWVADPFEVLLRTQLGGGTHIRLALIEAAKKIEEPPNTVLVLISDFYEGGSNQELLDEIAAIASSGVHFVPVGAVTSSGSFSVHPWFRDKLKDLGRPILTGNVTKLISQLKALL